MLTLIWNIFIISILFSVACAIFWIAVGFAMWGISSIKELCVV